MKFIKYVFFGALFGIILVKGEVISWFRIQEMFHFESFHMYGIIGSAVVVGAISIFILKALGGKDSKGEPLNLSIKTPEIKGHLIGGTIFGMGWALTGACPGPLYAHVGYGSSVMIMALLSAVVGTYVYGLLQHKLPH